MNGALKLDLQYLEMLSAGDPATRETLLRLLADELRTKPKAMLGAWGEADYSTLQQLCHHFKSTLPFAGNKQLTTLNRELEKQLKAGQKGEKIKGLIRQVDKAAAVLSDQVEQQLAPHSTKGK